MQHSGQHRLIPPSWHAPQIEQQLPALDSAEHGRVPGTQWRGEICIEGHRAHKLEPRSPTASDDRGSRYDLGRDPRCKQRVGEVLGRGAQRLGRDPKGRPGRHHGCAQGRLQRGEGELVNPQGAGERVAAEPFHEVDKMNRRFESTVFESIDLQPGQSKRVVMAFENLAPDFAPQRLELDSAGASGELALP